MAPTYGCDAWFTLACTHLPWEAKLTQSSPADFSLFELTDRTGGEILRVYVGSAPSKVTGRPAFERKTRRHTLRAFSKPDGDAIRVDIVVSETKPYPLTVHVLGNMIATTRSCSPGSSAACGPASTGAHSRTASVRRNGKKA
ncbi:hypothetical protein LVB87_13130 [Lysobacter sp. KIS68-7]|uniref:hypothetical protein n=1 Tax=Lysobacter sp. KIS68-7 TaxID=2904252 RepID=UPI001E4F7956|nr:hypothetical protein [Lysobacter sp. KIS68-7]UHQ19118.1 hypothetical protein LVB87_13130 [Lysobacter sp. KIS68-7]